MSKRKLIVLFGILAAALIAPYLAGLWLAGPDHIFGGFLFNPLDGNSYLAKMRLGWQGEWRFQLTYSPEPGKGAYLFLFYIFLGHLARISGISLPSMFHLARLLSSALLIYAFLRLYRRWLGDFSPWGFHLLVALTVFGSGMGWIAALFGAFTSDLWVSEAYPFLSMYANPHFPLSLALLLVYYDLLASGARWRQFPLVFAFGLALAVIQPFAVVVGAAISVGYLLWEWIETRRWPALPAAVGFAAGGGAFLLYQYSAIQSEPILSLWNAQNLTPTPPAWDVLIAFSPALILAAAAIIYLFRNRQAGRCKLFVIMIIAGIALAYFPFSLQRRFLLGYFIPCAFLGVMAIIQVSGVKSRLRSGLAAALLLLSMGTNLLVLLGGLSAIPRHDPMLFITKDENLAFAWMSAQERQAGPILASAETGMFIPAYTGWRVVYGHPFETVHAEQRKADINAIFDGSMSAGDIEMYLVRNRIRYIFWGPREQLIRTDNPFEEYDIAYQNSGVTIYRLGAD